MKNNKKGEIRMYRDSKVKKRLCLVILTILVMVIGLASPVSAARRPKLSATSVKIFKNKPYNLKLKYAKGTVTWSSGNNAVVSVTPVGQLLGNARGSTYVYARNAGRTYRCKVVVEEPFISGTNLEIIKGKTVQLRVYGTTRKVKWSSTGSSVASVSSSGKVKAKKAGTCTIRATVSGYGTFICKVKVINAYVKTDMMKRAEQAYNTHYSDIVSVFNLVNAERQKAGLPSLRLNKDLCLAACYRSIEQADRQQMSHTRPDGNSLLYLTNKIYHIKSPFGVGENLAKGYGTPQAVMTGWMNSKPHRENILRTGITDIGIGVTTAEKGLAFHYWTQIFFKY